jgi:hypothetical protein
MVKRKTMTSNEIILEEENNFIRQHLFSRPHIWFYCKNSICFSVLKALGLQLNNFSPGASEHPVHKRGYSSAFQKACPHTLAVLFSASDFSSSHGSKFRFLLILLQN